MSTSTDNTFEVSRQCKSLGFGQWPDEGTVLENNSKSLIFDKIFFVYFLTMQYAREKLAGNTTFAKFQPFYKQNKDEFLQF